MQKFDYYTPTKVIFGKGREAEVGMEMKKDGAKKAYIVYGGGSVKRSGLLDRVEEALKAENIEYKMIGGVKPNPRLSLAREGVEDAKAFGADFILAVGGGSVIDTAKGIAHGVANPDVDIWDFWEGKKKVEKSLAGFDKINKLTEPTSDDSSSGSNGSNGSSVAGSQVDYGSLNKGETELDGYSKKFAKIFKDMQKELAPTTEALKKLYNEGLSKLAGFSWNALKGFYTNFLVPVAKWTLGKGLPEFISALNDGLNNINYGKIENP